MSTHEVVPGCPVSWTSSAAVDQHGRRALLRHVGRVSQFRGRGEGLFLLFGVCAASAHSFLWLNSNDFSSGSLSMNANKLRKQRF
jgi:hypothetical protein